MTIKKLSLVILLLFSTAYLSAQFACPSNSKVELLGQSENLTRCKLFCNEVCNVFLFTENNVICSVAGSTDALPSVAKVPDAGNWRNAFFTGENLIVVRPKVIVALSQDMNTISQAVTEEVLYKFGKRDIKAFYSNSTGFFIVEHKRDKKTKSPVSALSYFDLTRNTAQLILEAEGTINCISGDTAVMCLGLDTNLLIIANRQAVVAATEKEDITAVTPSSAGVFYSTHSSVNFIDDDLHKIVIVEKGASQLVHNCNTLFMILEDGSLIRILNTVAFRSFKSLFKQEPDGTKNKKN